MLLVTVGTIHTQKVTRDNAEDNEFENPSHLLKNPV